jgi:RNA polymerase sigma factor (sigma-70 family)
MVRGASDWPSTRHTLIDLIRDSGNQAAWATFLHIYLPIVLGYCRRRLQEADALDVSNIVFLRVSKYVRRYDRGRGRFRDFLGVMTRNEINRYSKTACRIKSREGRQGVDDPGPDESGTDLPAIVEEPDLDWERISEAHLLESAIERTRPEFTEKQWQAFHAVAYRVDETPEGRAFVKVDKPEPTRVAHELGEDVGWVHKVKCLILKRLRQEVLFLAEDLDLLR